MNTRELTCCFTGHRNLPENTLSDILIQIRTVLIGLIERGVRYFGAGGALGFDSLAALVVLELREVYPHIKLILVLPCADQTNGRQPSDIAVYEQIKSAADKVVCLSNHYYRGCMHKRNRHLVDFSGHCVCYQTKSEGGTAYTTGYAKEQSLTIYNVVED